MIITQILFVLYWTIANGNTIICYIINKYFSSSNHYFPFSNSFLNTFLEINNNCDLIFVWKDNIWELAGFFIFIFLYLIYLCFGLANMPKVNQRANSIDREVDVICKTINCEDLVLLIVAVNLPHKKSMWNRWSKTYPTKNATLVGALDPNSYLRKKERSMLTAQDFIISCYFNASHPHPLQCGEWHKGSQEDPLTP